ncbi:AraC family transcriptional regulator [Flavobacteriaceae bacterium R38]|nr:AraC family transcriptional regulator [Flavobacteriaceae bacterium R38]
MSEDIIQKGDIRNFYGKKTGGKVNYSSLTHYYSKNIADSYSIKYVLKGNEEYIIDGKKHKVRKKQFLLVKPGQEVETFIEDKGVVEGMCIYFPSDLLEKEALKYNLDLYLLPEFPLLPAYSLLNDSLEKTIVDPDMFLERFVEGLAQFMAKNNCSLKAINAEKTTTKLDLWEKIEKARYYMIENLDKNLLLDNIASQACMSAYHFQRTFKAFNAISPSAYFLRQKMKKAKSLQSEEKFKLKDIAHQCGFDDVKYFRKCLKKYNN